MTRHYTRTEFLTELARRGYRRTSRWHEQWIGIGLLDRGTRRGKGGRATWPQNQVQLAAALLHHADKGVHLASLTNLVTWIWLWWGDEFVPFRQIPRALRTWVNGEREPAEKHVRAAARELVARIAHPAGSGKRRLSEVLVDFTYRPTEADKLRSLFDDVFDPERTGKARGPAGAALSTDLYIRHIEVQLGARAHLATFTEGEYRSARELYRRSRIEYAIAQPGYALDPDLGRFYEAPTLNEVANNASSNLLTCLEAVRRLARRF